MSRVRYMSHVARDAVYYMYICRYGMTRNVTRMCCVRYICHVALCTYVMLCVMPYIHMT